MQNINKSKYIYKQNSPFSLFQLPGRWYLVAMSSNTCLPAAIFNTVFWPSIAADFTSKDTPNIYDGNIKIKM